VGRNVNQIRDSNVEGEEKVYIRESKWQGGNKFTIIVYVPVKRRQKTAPLGAVFGTPSTASTAETVAHVFDIHKQFSRRL
jgi:hypothetical protein